MGRHSGAGFHFDFFFYHQYRYHRTAAARGGCDSDDVVFLSSFKLGRL